MFLQQGGLGFVSSQKEKRYQPWPVTHLQSNFDFVKLALSMGSIIAGWNEKHDGSICPPDLPTKRMDLVQTWGHQIHLRKIAQNMFHQQDVSIFLPSTCKSAQQKKHGPFIDDLNLQTMVISCDFHIL